MESFEAMTRKVGNSVGVLIPAETLGKERLKAGQKVRVTIAKRVDDNLFGRFKGFCTPKELDKMVRENKDAWGD